MPYRELNFDSENIVFAMSEVKSMFRMHFGRGCRHVAKRTYNKILAVDFDSFINAGRYQRTSRRRSYRNGSRQRRLLTQAGEITVTVPRDRAGKYQPDMLERYKRVDRGLDELIRQMFLNGVSTRKVGDILEVLCEERLSPSYVSKVNKELDSAVKEFLNSPIDDDFRFLFLDALTIKVRMELRAKRFMLLVAYGIRSDGSRSLIGFQRAKSESYACWRTFLENLKVRGLKGENLELVVMDGAAGLWKAVEEIHPLVEHQLCWVHKLRNVSNYCPKKYREEFMAEVVQIMYAPSSSMAAKRFRVLKRKWQARIPKAIRCLEDDFDRLIPVFGFPENIRKMIRTTNVIERCFREVRRRLRVMGYFQNSKSSDRIVYALFAYFNSKWKRNTEIIRPIRDIYKDAA
jgi:putative transposase